jgi:putative FmdB family regulatory protein
MPIYEYECTKCGHQAEVWQKISDGPMSKCQLCNGKVRKLISQSTFHLKGSGWYVTDYSSKHSGSEVGKETSTGEEGTTSKKEETAGNKPKKEASTTNAKKGTE